MALRYIVSILIMGILSGSISHAHPLQSNLDRLSASYSGRLGVCVLGDSERAPVCVRGNETFPLQSVMKLIVGAAVLDAVDQGEIRLGNEIEVNPNHISPGPEDFANLVTHQGVYKATVEELLRRSIVDSDSTSVDVLIDYIGGVGTVQNFIARKSLSGIRVDRTERELQSDSVGLSWKPEYSDLRKFDAAVESLPVNRRNEAWRAHVVDPRDRATPLGMVDFLRALIEGRLLSDSSTEKLLSIMAQTATGKDRLRAGIPTGWEIAHKTGTGRTWEGETETTNDVGIITAPDGTKIALAVFLARSRSTAEDQAAVLARVASLVCKYYDSKSEHRR